MSDFRDQVISAVANLLKPLGFRRRGATWTVRRNGLTVLFNVQASEWDDSVYLNLGFMIDGPEDRATVSLRDCNVRFRIERLNVIDMADCLLLDASSWEDLGGAKWNALFADRIAHPAMTAISGVNDSDDLRTLLRDAVSENIFIRADVRQSLAGIHETDD